MAMKMAPPSMILPLLLIEPSCYYNEEVKHYYSEHLTD
jgi:hypothetical protein